MTFGTTLVKWFSTLFTCCHSCSCVQSAPVQHYSFTNFHPQFLSLYSGVALLYITGLFSTSVINLSLSKILKSRSMRCALTWNIRQTLVAVKFLCRYCAQAGMFFRVPLPPHRPENEACCVWKNAAVK